MGVASAAGPERSEHHLFQTVQELTECALGKRLLYLDNALSSMPMNAYGLWLRLSRGRGTPFGPNGSCIPRGNDCGPIAGSDDCPRVPGGVCQA